MYCVYGCKMVRIGLESKLMCGNICYPYLVMEIIFAILTIILICLLYETIKSAKKCYTKTKH